MKTRHSVAVVAKNRETLDGVHAYLVGAGVSARATRELDDSALISASTRALVLFPDEYDAAEVASRIAALRASRPGLLLVVVTSSPQLLQAALAASARSVAPVVLPKPAFGWTILDAVRAQVQAETP